MKLNPLLLTDGYKTGHHNQYPPGTSLVYGNFTPRANKYAPNKADHVMVFGTQMAFQEIHELFARDFFAQPKVEVITEIKKELSLYLGCDYDTKHFEELHDLGYLPIAVRALPEGNLSPIRVPVLTIRNTHPKFYWVTNYLETIISSLLWKPMTSASIAFQYRVLLESWQRKTDPNASAFVDWQAHDFSMRGMDSIYAVASSGLGHATAFLGSDSLPVIAAARHYYPEKAETEKEIVIGSVNATEHSVMCAGGRESEIETYRRLLRIYPKGILSVVSDTWDLWKVLTEHLPVLKDEILGREGKLVIRPDSGNPADILCGYNSLTEYDYKEKQINVEAEHPSQKGVVEILWDLFGGSVNEQGFKVLNPRVGAIYGDSITLPRADEICRRLAGKGFATTNVVLGIGSYTYQYNTRDAFGFAMKATYVEIDGEEKEIFKDPATDSGLKKSATGLLRVDRDSNGDYALQDKIKSWDAEGGELELVYRDGEFFQRVSLSEIRKRVSQDVLKTLCQRNSEN